MPTHYRECPQCGEAIEGRPNKKFCNDTCKGRYFRDNNLAATETDTNPHALALKYPVDDVSLAYDEELAAAEYSEDQEEEDESSHQNRILKRLAAEEKKRKELAEATELHQTFCSVVDELLEAEGRSLTARNTDMLIRTTKSAIETYQKHPCLKSAESLSSRRLKALYTLYDVLQEVAQEIADKGLWQGKESHFELTNKGRNRLRKLLIAD